MQQKSVASSKGVDLDWEEMFNLSIDLIKARNYREESKPTNEDSCTMCGKNVFNENCKKDIK